MGLIGVVVFIAANISTLDNSLYSQQQWVNPNEVTSRSQRTPIIQDAKVEPAGFESSLEIPGNRLDRLTFELPAESPVLSAQPIEGLQSLLQTQMTGVDWQKMIASLALVIGGYMAMLWLIRIVNPRGSRGLPPQVVEVIGQTRFNAKQNLQLVRLGNKLLLLLASSEGAQSIGEVTDPIEVEYLIALCGNRRAKRQDIVIQHRERNQHIQSNSSNVMMEQIVSTLQRALKQPGGQTEYEA
jgi:flagellar biogenesis protein FliO